MIIESSITLYKGAAQNRSGDKDGGMLIGYIQAKQGDENGLLAQRQALEIAGCRQLVEDLTSGSRWDQPGW